MHFDDKKISTEYSALMSKVMQDGTGRIKFPINEPATGKRKSQIEEYLEYYHGPGVQHIALRHRRHRRDGLTSCARNGVEFLRVPLAPTTRTSRAASARSTSRWTCWPSSASSPTATTRAICCRSSRSRSQDRPTLFFEVIERHGSRGFGDGNFKSLFEAIEREQARRGNLV